MNLLVLIVSLAQDLMSQGMRVWCRVICNLENTIFEVPDDFYRYDG